LTVGISVNGKPQGTAPVEIRLKRRRRGHVIRIESRGYNPFEIQVGRDATAPRFLMSALLGATVGGLVAAAQATSRVHRDFWADLAIDAPVGAAMFLVIDLMPGKERPSRERELAVTLTKAEGTPRVDTMSVAAGDFLKIKWIRVHRD